jgi:cell division protein FtsB
MNPKALITPVLCYGALVLTIGIFRGEHSIANYFELRHSREILDKTVAGLQGENSEISKEIVRIKKSKGYARKVLRDKYHITDDDEKIIFFAD